MIFAWWIGAGFLYKKMVNLSTHHSSLFEVSDLEFKY